MAHLAFHAAEDARSNQGTKGVTNQAPTGEHGSPDAELFLRIPFAQEKQGARKESGLYEPQEKACE